MTAINLKADSTELFSAIYRLNTAVTKCPEIGTSISREAEELGRWCETEYRYTSDKEATVFILPSTEFLALVVDAESYCNKNGDQRIKDTSKMVARALSKEVNIQSSQDNAQKSIMGKLDNIEAALLALNRSQESLNILAGPSKTQALVDLQHQELRRSL